MIRPAMLRGPGQVGRRGRSSVGRSGVRPTVLALAVLGLVSLWGGDPIFGDVPPEPGAQDPVSALVHLAPGGELSVELHFAPDFPPPTVLTNVDTVAGHPPERFRMEGGGTGLRFQPSTTPDAVAVLRQAQEALRGREGEAAQLPVIVQIPTALEGADIWDLQAALSQAGIRRVRIRSGG